jgi:large subunit ribosomal protein L24
MAHVKKNDEVVVIAGTERGKRGKILEVLPKNQRVIIEGIKMIKKHTKRSQQYPEGRIVEREGTIHISNVVRAEEFDARAAKRGAGANAEPAKA